MNFVRNPRKHNFALSAVLPVRQVLAKRQEDQTTTMDRTGTLYRILRSLIWY